MATIQYRLAQPADMHSLARLRRDGEAGGASEERMRRYLLGEHHPQHALLPRIVWLAETTVPVGYIAGHLTRRFGCQGELQWIYVVSQYRGSGLAGDLLRHLAAWFVERGARRVCVDVGDPIARRFYARQGAENLNEHWMVWSDIGVLVKPDCTSPDPPSLDR